MDEFQDELSFDPTVSSGHCVVLGGGFRATPVSFGVCPTPQPAPKPEQPTAPIPEMTPSEAEVLLADRLMERRSRAGSVLSVEHSQAEMEMGFREYVGNMLSYDTEFTVFYSFSLFFSLLSYNYVK